MNIAICDDQKMYNDKLKSMLKDYFKRTNIENFSILEYTSGKKLSDDYSCGLFDFIFLDIQMPDLSGEETASRVRKKDVEVNIIFVTNMKDQSLMGYNYGAKGFLLKGVKQEDIDSLMDRLLSEMGRRKDTGFYLVKQKSDKSNIHLRLSDVLYFESNDKVIFANLEDGNIEFRGQLNNVEDDLRERGFIRIHRSLLVNISHVFKDFFDRLIIRTGEELAISKNYRDRVRKTFSLKGRVS